jgi:predicted lipid-binding transport protein (Tim44 family)
MNEGFQFLDIIFFAMIAAFLVLRLRSVLGRRNSNQSRPRDDRARREKESEVDGNVIDITDRATRIDSGAEDPAEDLSDDPVAAGLAEIRGADDSFDPSEFIDGARSAFEMIVHAFAIGDTSVLKTMLSNDVLENFQTALQQRIEAQETLETTVIGVKSADVIEAEMRNKMAVITIKFVSEQVNVTRDEEGHVVDGDPNQPIDVTDIWTFARAARSRNPNWKLIETRSPN